MSASLVGSEMCIRDRRRPTRCRSGPWPQPAPTPRRPSGSCRSRRRPPPVSYTHLTLPTICSV
eukprot:230279-Alexandrium_andersonii.AAC.1